jgi:hypothetical protein
VKRQEQTEHSGRKGRGWRRAKELTNSELSLILKDREGGEGSAEERREREGNGEGSYRGCPIFLLCLGSILIVPLACRERERVSRIRRKGKGRKERRLREGS